MASFFGEIVTDISRAVDEDDDDDEIDYVPSSINLQWTQEASQEIKSAGQLKCTRVVFAVGPAATGFVQTYITAGQTVDELAVANTEVSDEDGTASTRRVSANKLCSGQRLSAQSTVILVQCSTEALPEQTFSLTQQCLTNLDLSAAHVTVLTSSLTSQYSSDSAPGDLRVPFLRALCTDGCREKPVCPYLEQPNTVPGLAAQVMTFCQVHGVPAVLYISYTDILHLDTQSIVIFTQLRKDVAYKGLILDDNPTSTDMLTKQVHCHGQHNLLYI